MSENVNMPAATGDAYWRDPAIEPPPLGRKLLLLTSGGVAALGDWMTDSNFVAWSPLPKRPLTKPDTGGKPNYVTPATDEAVASLMTNIQSGDIELVWNDDGFNREMWHETPLYTAPQKRQPADTTTFQLTHAEGCWSWGPKHFLCACAEIARLKGYK